MVSLQPMKTLSIKLPGKILASGFWLYIWRVGLPNGKKVFYVGRTGDSSSPNAAPPYRRLGQHLGFIKASNSLRCHLLNRRCEPESCHQFEFITFGPLFPLQKTMTKHKPFRDKTAALEKKLADTLRQCGYDVLNEVKCRKELDLKLWERVRRAFVGDFPKLKSQSCMR